MRDVEKPPLTVADVIRAHGAELVRAMGSRLTSAHRKVLTHLSQCRTPALGGHVRVCNQCGDAKSFYNSCRDRHCPDCGGARGQQWLEARAADLLEVPYFHVVFTIPDELNPLVLGNKAALYNVLFAAASRTLLEVAADERHLRAHIGFFAVLHTWGQLLQLHPHLHCVIPAGGFSVDDGKPVVLRNRYFLPVKVLSVVFRGKFLDFLGEAFRDGKVHVAGGQSAFEQLVGNLHHKPWVVYAKQAFSTPHHVLRYLARYTHRVAITHHRLISLQNGMVTFRYKDYRQRGETRVATMAAVEFVRRFLLHTLPHGLQRIRHYGFLSNRNRTEQLVALKQAPLPGALLPTANVEGSTDPQPQAQPTCPCCGGTTFELLPLPLVLERPTSFWDTS